MKHFLLMLPTFYMMLDAWCSSDQVTEWPSDRLTEWPSDWKVAGISIVIAPEQQHSNKIITINNVAAWWLKLNIDKEKKTINVVWSWVFGLLLAPGRGRTKRHTTRTKNMHDHKKCNLNTHPASWLLESKSLNAATAYQFELGSWNFDISSPFHWTV